MKYLRGGSRLSLIGLLVICSGVACSRESTQEAVSEDLAKYVLDEVPATLQHRLHADFGGKVQLLGYDIAGGDEGAEPSPGDDLELTLYWRSSARLMPGWKLFTHLLDGRGETIANLDDRGPLRSGGEDQALPPSAWRPGHIYADPLEFTLPRDSAGPTTLVVGVWQSDARLGLVGGSRAGRDQTIVTHFNRGGLLAGGHVVANEEEEPASDDSAETPAPAGSAAAE